jgi:hypothetical protein
MNRFVLLFMLFSIGQTLHAQYVYTIKADSVKITNSCDTAELIIENHTQNVSGFLFNKGRGRTEFRKAAIKLNDSMYLIGADTLNTSIVPHASNGLSVSNGEIVLGQNTAQSGDPAVLLSDRKIPMNGFGLEFNNGLISMYKNVTSSSNSGVLNLSSTWNTTGAPTALKLNVTNTASGAGSYLMDIQEGGTSKLRIPATSANMLFNSVGVQIRDNSNGTGGISFTDYAAEWNSIFFNPGFRLANVSGNTQPNVNCINFQSEGIVPTSGTTSILNVSTAPFLPTSGTASLNMLNLASAINQTGGASGITRGICINPVLVSAVDFRAIEVVTGKSIFNGKVSINNSSSPTAGLLLGAGTSTAGTAPIKLTAGTLLSTPENGAVEFDGADLYITENSTRYKLTKTITGQLTTSFGAPSLAAYNSVTTTLSVAGAQAGDVVTVSANTGAVNPPSIIITAYVTSANTVTLQAYNASNSAVTLASDTYKVRVIR